MLYNINNTEHLFFQSELSFVVNRSCLTNTTVLPQYMIIRKYTSSILILKFLTKSIMICVYKHLVNLFFLKNSQKSFIRILWGESNMLNIYDSNTPFVPNSSHNGRSYVNDFLCCLLFSFYFCLKINQHFKYLHYGNNGHFILLSEFQFVLLLIRRLFVII